MIIYEIASVLNSFYQGYVAGACPNLWGVFADGSTVMDLLKKEGGSKKDIERRSHPLFGYVLLQVDIDPLNQKYIKLLS